MKPRLGLIACLVLALPAIALAKGRQPDDEDRPDNFPDYNKLEMRPKPKAPPPPVADVTPPPAPPINPAPPPALNTPVNAPAADDDTPKPPPKAVPLPDGASEPPLPEDIKDTLVPSTTAQ